jgi:MoaA/NifB/PqqE/SkfB family radical SAM enzyme
MSLSETTPHPVVASSQMKLPRDLSQQDLSFLVLEITGKCNLECVHCYANSSPRADLFGRMSSDDWVNVIETAAQLGCRSVQFIGGEPTLHPALDNFIACAKNSGFEQIEVFTNATTLTESRLAFYRKNEVSIATSFYSCDQGIHEHITRGKGNFQKTVQGIRATVEMGIPIRVGVIWIEGINVNDKSKTLTFLKELGVSRVGEDSMRGIGRSVKAQINDESDEYYSALCGQCWKGSLCVTPDGSAYPCVFTRISAVGNVLEQGIQAVVEGRALQNTRMLLCNKFSGRTLQSDCVPQECQPRTCSPQVCEPQVCGPLSCGPRFP